MTATEIETEIDLVTEIGIEIATETGIGTVTGTATETETEIGIGIETETVTDAIDITIGLVDGSVSNTTTFRRPLLVTLTTRFMSTSQQSQRMRKCLHLHKLKEGKAFEHSRLITAYYRR